MGNLAPFNIISALITPFSLFFFLDNSFYFNSTFWNIAIIPTQISAQLLPPFKNFTPNNFVAFILKPIQDFLFNPLHPFLKPFLALLKLFPIVYDYIICNYHFSLSI